LFKKVILLLLVLTIVFPSTIPQTFADDMTVKQVCNNNRITILVYYDDEPISNANVHIYSDSRNTDLIDTIKTDSLGQVIFDYSQNTKTIKVSKGGFNDLRITLSCIEEFRTQSMNIFSLADSHIGIFEELDMTIIDLGTIFGIAGSGTIPDRIDVYSKQVNVSIPRESVSPSSTHGDWQIGQDYFTRFSDEGIWTLNLITDEKITYTFQFEVRQVSSIPVKHQYESTLEVENRELGNEILLLEKKNSELQLKIENLTNIIMEQIKVIMDMIQKE